MRKFGKWLGRLTLSLAIALAFGYGFYGMLTYVVPLSQDNYTQARKSIVADETEVLINGATEAYEHGRLPEAAKVFELTLEKMVDKSGRYKPSDRWKLERVYFMLGKCYQKMEVYDRAAENYQETLRLNPNHLDAKYNLEQIKPNGEGEGKGDGTGGKDGDKKSPTDKLPPKI